MPSLLLLCVCAEHHPATDLGVDSVSPRNIAVDGGGCASARLGASEHDDDNSDAAAAAADDDDDDAFSYSEESDSDGACGVGAAFRLQPTAAQPPARTHGSRSPMGWLLTSDGVAELMDELDRQVDEVTRPRAMFV